jgi:hypothetical protein
MYKVLTDIGIIAQYRDTGIETIEEAETIAEEYAAQGYIVEIRDEDTDDSVKLYNVSEEE